MSDSRESANEAASIERAKKSASAAGRTLIEEGAGLKFGVPGKVIAKLGLTLLEHAASAVRDRWKRNAAERTQALLSAIATDESNGQDLTEAQVLELVQEDPTDALDSILGAALHDEEAGKVRIYGRFYRGLLKGRFPVEEKIRFLKAMKSLSLGAVEILKTFVAKNDEETARIANEGGSRRDLGAFAHKLREDNPLEVQQLVFYGLFDDQHGNKAPFPNERGAAFIRGLYPPL